MEEEIENIPPIGSNSESRYIFNNQNVILQNKIGKGCQGCVHIGLNTQTKQRYAIKVINMGNMTEKQKQRLNCQIHSNFTLSHIYQHQYFPYFYGYWTCESQIFLVFQLCEGNALEGIRSNRTHAASYSFAYILLYDILKGLELLQQRNIIHRDLKPENMLLDKGRFKICDLGLSKLAEKGKKLTVDVGNLMSRSPESYSQVYDCRTDIWSLGINVFWIAFGTLPFDEQMKQLLASDKIVEIKERISQQNFQINLGPIHTNLINILSDMLQPRFPNRLNSHQLLSKYFYQTFDSFPINSPIQIQVKELFYLYLKSRDSRQLSLLLLCTILLVIDNQKVQDYLRSQRSHNEKVQNSKKEICRRVKINIFLIMKFMYESFEMCENDALAVMEFYLRKWEKELEQYTQNKSKMGKKLKKIEEGLKMHTVQAIKERFPLVVEAVKIFNKIEEEEEICLWNIASLDLRWLKI